MHSISNILEAVADLVPDSRGRHELLALLDSKNQPKIAELYKIPQTSISQIKDRKRRPGLKLAQRFERAGIEYGWWFEPPTKAQLAADRSRLAKGAA